MSRHDWTQSEVQELYQQPFNDLLFQAHTVHRENFDPNAVQISTLLSIKTGGCPEDCKYCPQSVHYDTGLDVHGLLPEEDVIKAATKARDAGATRLCMGAAWRSPKDRDMPQVLAMVRGVHFNPSLPLRKANTASHHERQGGAAHDARADSRKS